MLKGLVKRIILPSIILVMLFSFGVQAADCAVYIVEKGDCLWEISENFQVNLSEVIAFNPQFTNPDLIYPGETVYVPVTVVNRERASPKVTNHVQTTPVTPVPSETETKVPETETPPTTAPTTENAQTEAPQTTVPETEPETIGVQLPDNNLPEAELPPDETAAEENNVYREISTLEAQVFELVNQERAKVGLAALTLNLEVSNAGRLKSQDMINKNYFSHTSPTYGSPSNLLTSLGIKYTASGENIAYGQRTAEAVMQSWMSSEGHRANILSSNFTQIGIGCVSKSDGTLYWTQLFIKP